MSLGRLQVTDLRCLQKVELELDPGLTLINGANGSGKTSLLEAIYVLGRGRSFRTRHSEHLIRRGAERFIIFGEAEVGQRHVRIGIEGSIEGMQARIAGAATASLAELASILPVQIIDPEVHKLIEEGPSRRRRYLDWGVFHVEPRFIDNWQRYGQVLRQRNAALKSRQPRHAVAIWDAELVRYGQEVSDARYRYLEQLNRQLAPLARRLLDMELNLNYRTGWPRNLAFAEALLQSWPLDQERGITQIGPHRAELAIHLNGISARDHISRGQQKLLAAALLIGQIKLFRPDTEIRPSLLLDDPAAELDDVHLARLIEEISESPNQLIVTTIQSDFAIFGTPGRRYRIENGKISSE